MKERPILFTPENAQKCFDGTKTQTRRIVKPQPSNEWLPMVGLYCPTLVDRDGGSEVYGASDENEGVPCPYGMPGGRLWVREVFCIHPLTNQYWYKGEGRTDVTVKLKWTSSLYVPRWACRTVLEITEIRVERVQEISEADALAEGVTVKPDAEIAARVAGDTPARMEFRALWTAINGDDSWADNPWVWCISFQKVSA